MNQYTEATRRTRPALKLLAPALLACLAIAGCAEENADMATAETADGLDATAEAPAITEPATDDATRPLADQTFADPCTGLTGTALDECLANQESLDATGDAGALDDGLMEDEGVIEDEQSIGDTEMLDEEPTEEPMDEEAVEDPAEVPPPA